MIVPLKLHSYICFICVNFQQALKTLTSGIFLVKLPRRGSPRKHRCFVEFAPNNSKANAKIPASMYIFRWDSSSKSSDEASVVLQDCQLLLGQQTDIFDKHRDSVKDNSELSFSLLTHERSIDLMASSPEEFVCIVRFLSRFVRVVPEKKPASK
jgi:hypothetical protein